VHQWKKLSLVEVVNHGGRITRHVSRSQSCLYDKQSPDFKNIHKKQNAWTEIATAMATNGKCWTKKCDIALFRNGVVEFVRSIKGTRERECSNEYVRGWKSSTEEVGQLHEVKMDS
jgi:hypothetical protein